MKMRMRNDCVLIRLDDEQEETAGGLAIPVTARERPRTGTVVAAGDGKTNEEGVFIPTQVSPGERVIVTWLAGQELTIDGATYWIVKEQSINERTKAAGMLAVIG